MSARLIGGWFMLMVPAAVLAAEQPFGVLDVALGASYARMQNQLDMRDINTAISGIKGGKPDLGRRGYGCMNRDDPYADVGCVSHDEKLDGVETREIRLHFLQGRLQQFSVTAEVQYFDAVIGYLHRRYGEPRLLAAPDENTAPSLRWQDEAGQVTAYRGKDLVFVNFELASYANAVKRKREGSSLECS